MKKWIIIGIVGIFVVLYLISVFTPKAESSYSRKGVGILEIKGILEDPKEELEVLEKLLKRKDVKALLVYINSPGGGVVASQELYYAIRKFKEEKKIPVISYISSIGASGGYYVAIAGDKIMAAPGAITGSIGVIASFPAYYKLLKKVGIDFRVLKKGKFKDAGSPFRDLTEEEKEYLTQLLQDIYDQFVEEVAKRRNLDMEELHKWAEGKIFTGRRAKEIGLVDTIGTYQDALMLAGSLAGIKGKPKEIKIPKKKRGFLKRILESIFEIPMINIEYRTVF